VAKHNQSEQEQRCARLKQVFADLANRGITQRHAAIELNVPPQYLSDVKNGHRSLTEPFARRIAEVYGVSFVWLVSGQGPKSISRLDVRGTSQTDTVMLPVLAEPIEGDPAVSVAWDGSKLEVSGAAAAIAGRASQPYILRISNNDVDGRLRKNDLVLVSQKSTESTTIELLQHRGRIVLARRESNGGWKVIDTGRAVSAKAKTVGYCLGIVWAKL
jgi:transcriptional regulator with XRE-family HTH domain